MAKVVKFEVEMTVIEARALVDVVGRANDLGNIEEEEANPIDWVMTRIASKLNEADEHNIKEASHG